MEKCVLIVDDSPVIRRVLRGAIETIPDCKVCGEAVDGRDAIQKARDLNPDLIVLDLSMPVMNGLEAARELKRVNPHVPLLMLTSFKTPNLEKEAILSGFTAVITKSEAYQLLEQIQELLHRPP
jgi:DNA-binding NarL/FixJ family response regulator